VAQGLRIGVPYAMASFLLGEGLVTEAGLDVSGFSYCTFASGVTVFCPSAHRLTVLNEA